MKKLVLMTLLLLAIGLIFADNITPIRTDVAGFPSWTDTDVAGTTYIQLLVADANTVSPAMNFNDYTGETLDFKARTFGGTNAVENEITVSISTDNGANWSPLGTRTPLTNSLVAMTQFDLSSYSGTQVKIKFSVAGTSNTVGAGIDDITIAGTPAVSTPTISVNPSTLSGFTYVLGSGPSASQSFSLTGTALTNAVSVSVSSNYQISSTEAGTYGSTLSLTPTSGNVSATVYVQQIASLPIGTAYSGTVTCSSNGATDATVSLSGTVTDQASTIINFDDDAKWTAGSAALTSYAVDHTYVDGLFSATGGPALRNLIAAQDGYPGALGTYSWRLKNEAGVEWIMNISGGGVSTFSVAVRRWDNSPDPNYDLDYSIDGGSNWTNVTTINNAALDNSSDWKTFNGTITSANNNIKIRFKSNGATERIMVDNFAWNNYGEAPPTPVINVIGVPDPLANYAGVPSEEVSSYLLSVTDPLGPIFIVAPEGFEVSSNSASGWASSIEVAADFNGDIYVRLVSEVLGDHSGDITHNSFNAAEVTVRAVGETLVSPVTWNISANLTAFNHVVGTPSTVQSYTLSASGALGVITVSVASPLELSKTGSSGWNGQLTFASNFNGLVYVRMNSTSAGTFSADIEHTSYTATPELLPVSGTATPPAGIYATDLFFSEYIEGSSSNKALEIFNGTGLPVDLSNYKVYLYSNGSLTPTNTLLPTGTLAHNDVYVIANASANAAILALADVTSTVTFYNGDDAVSLVKVVDSVETYVDIFGVIGQDPGTQWTADGGYSTLDKTLVRKPTVTGGVTVNPTATTPAVTTDFVTLGTEWDVYPIDTITDLGVHTFAPGAQIAVAPILSPGAGVYSSTVNVSMSSTTPNAVIYYTTDGTVPSDTNGFTFNNSNPVAVSVTTTIKAIAYATGYTHSSVTTANYVFPTLVSNIAELRAQTPGATMYKLTGQAVLTFQQSTRHQKYIQDATAAILIDDAAGKITTAYNLYDGITGVTGTLNLYNGLLQFIPVADPGAATSTNNVITPELCTLASLTSADQAKLIKVLNVTIDPTTVTFGTLAENINVTDATATLVMRTFPATDYSSTAIPVVPVNLTCLVGQFGTTMQVSPRFLADIEAIGAGLEVPVVQVSQAGGTITLTWAAIAGATSYEIWTATDPYGTYTRIEASWPNTTWTETSATMKFYKVIAKN